MKRETSNEIRERDEGHDGCPVRCALGATAPVALVETAAAAAARNMVSKLVQERSGRTGRVMR
eukprot:9621194-Heterocapsa_arctica.AAC.1